MKLTIGKRLSFGFLLLILITVAIGAISVNYFSKLNSTNKRITQKYFPRIGTVNEIKDSIQGLEKALTSYTLGSKNPESEAELHKNIDFVKTNLGTLKKLYSAKNTTFQSWHKEFSQNFKTVQMNVVTLIEAKSNPQRNKLSPILEETFRITDELKKECNRLRKEVLEDIDRLSTLATVQSQAGYKWVFILLSLGLLVSVTLAYFTTSSLVKPIRKFMKATEEVSKGDLAVKLEVKGPVELEKLAQSFRDMTKKLQDVFEQQKYLVGVVSHQLRTPLTIIRGNAEVTLRSREQTLPEYQEALKNIIAVTHEMSGFITKLLTLTQAEFGQLQLNLTKIKLKELLSEVIQDSQVLAQERGLDLKLGFETDGIVLGDRERLKELFFILLDNSLKYTNSPGTIRIQGLKENDYLKVLVSDTGVGIPQEALPHIFERFYRAQKNNVNTPQGAGIGLAIARWITETHQGKIYAESQPDRGTTITVLLPEIKEG